MSIRYQIHMTYELDVNRFTKGKLENSLKNYFKNDKLGTLCFVRPKWVYEINSNLDQEQIVYVVKKIITDLVKFINNERKLPPNSEIFKINYEIIYRLNSVRV